MYLSPKLSALRECEHACGHGYGTGVQLTWRELSRPPKVGDFDLVINVKQTVAGGEIRVHDTFPRNVAGVVRVFDRQACVSGRELERSECTQAH